nr:YfbU family protein [Sphingomonas sp. Y57]
MTISTGERLIAVMLSDIMTHLKIQGDIDPALAKTLLCNKDTWALEWEYSSIFNKEPGPSQAVIDETADIMTMWSVIEASVQNLSGPDQIEAKKLRWQFDGFDGNHDPHFGVAHTLVNDLNRFSEFTGRSLNSHSSTSLSRYRVMKPKFDHEMSGFTGILDLAALTNILS